MQHKTKLIAFIMADLLPDYPNPVLASNCQVNINLYCHLKLPQKKIFPVNFITSGEFLFLNYGPTELTTITYLDTSYSTLQSV